MNTQGPVDRKTWNLMAMIAEVKIGKKIGHQLPGFME